MIDIGPNLSHEQFSHDLPEVIERAKKIVSGMILTSTDLTSFKRNLDIISQYGTDINIKTTYGLHPHYAQKSDTIFEHITHYLSHPDVVAIGEFGLDYFRMINPKSKQIEVMEKFLFYAKQYPHLSLFLHEREAFHDFYNLLKNHNNSNPSVVHCFTGNKHNAQAYLDLGCYIGVTGWLSDMRRNQDVVEALQYIPIERLMIETDCPYLTPRNMPQKSFRNEPSFLIYVAQSLADIKKLTLNEVLEKTSQTTLDFFHLDGYNKKNNLKI